MQDLFSINHYFLIIILFKARDLDTIKQGFSLLNVGWKLINILLLQYIVQFKLYIHFNLSPFSNLLCVFLLTQCFQINAFSFNISVMLDFLVGQLSAVLQFNSIVVGEDILNYSSLLKKNVLNLFSGLLFGLSWGSTCP